MNPIKYAHAFVSAFFLWLYYEYFVDSHDLFSHTLQGSFTDTYVYAPDFNIDNVNNTTHWHEVYPH